MLKFLTELEANNTLEWMRGHKEQYLEAKNDFLKFIQDLIFSISEFDPSVTYLRSEDLLYRLNRDTRFSNDKSPYNASFRAHISSGGKKPIPAGYYVCIRPASSFLGAGLFASAFPQATTMIRDYIIQNVDKFKSINSDFSGDFVLEGEKLKNIPRGYDKEHPLAEYIKYKSFYIEYHISDKQIIENDIEFISQKFKQMKPMNDFLNEALRGFEMPKR